MALHTDLPIYKTGCDLVALALKSQEQMPRGMKRTLGEKINTQCVEMLTLMALANATRGAERASSIRRLLEGVHVATILLRVSYDARYISPKLWAASVQLLDSIGKQGGGWLKSSN
jgi:hypothetical protein